MRIDDKKLNGFTENVQRAYSADRENNDNFFKYMEYVFNICLTEDDRALLERNQSNTLNFSDLRPYVLQYLKAIMDAGATVYYKAVADNEYTAELNLPPAVVADQLTEKLLEIFEYSDFEDVKYCVAQDQGVGGKGVFKIRADYQNKVDFKQTFFIEHVEDPTYVYFDPSAKDKTAKDARWVAQRTDLPKDKFKEMYPQVDLTQLPELTLKGRNDFGWVTTSNNNFRQEDIISVLDYYFYKTTRTKKYLLPTGEVVSEKPQVLERDDDTKTLQKTEMDFRERVVEKREVWRVRYVGTTIIDKPRKTVFEDMPFVLVTSESYTNREGKKCFVPYAKHGFDAMRSKNFMLNYYMAAVLNNPTKHTYRVADSARTDDLDAAIARPQEADVQVYNDRVSVDTPAGPQEQIIRGGVEDVPIPPLPNALIEAAQAMSSQLPSIFGTQFPSLESMNNVSGKALYNLAQYMSASIEIAMQNFLRGISQVAEIVKNAMPNLLAEETVELINPENNDKIEQAFDYEFPTSHFKVVGHRGVSTQLQKEAAFEKLMQYSQTSPVVAQFLQTPPMVEQMIQLLDLPNEPKFIKMLDSFFEQGAQQANTPNPQMMQEAQAQQQNTQIENTKAQASLMNAKANMLKAEAQSDNMQADQGNNQKQMLLDLAKLQVERNKNILSAAHQHDKATHDKVMDILQLEQQRGSQ